MLEGFTLTRATIPSGANGTTNLATRTVTIADHLSPAQAAKTLTHELAQCRLHTGMGYALGCRVGPKSKPNPSPTRLSGRRTYPPAYSFGYVAGWFSGGDPKIIKATAERVVTCARQILDRAGLLGPADQREAA
jgi:hypothetical protein